MSEKVVAECDCGKAYRLPAKYAGKHIRCKECGDAFEVPSLEESLAESGDEIDLADEESEVVDPPPKRKKSVRDKRPKASSRRAEESAEDKPGRKKGARASGVRKGARGDSESGKTKRRKTASRKKDEGDEDKAGRKKGARASGIRKGRKKDDSESGKAGKRRPARRGRRRGDDEEGGKKPAGLPIPLIAGGGGLLLLIVIIALVAGGGGPTLEKGDKGTLEAIRSKVLGANQMLENGQPLNAEAEYKGAIQTYETFRADERSPDPADFEQFQDIPRLIDEARSRVKEATRLAELYEGATKGETSGLSGLVSSSKSGERMYAIVLLEQVVIFKKKDNAKDEITSLATLAKDSDKDVAFAAQEKLCQFNVVEALPYLLERLDAGPEVRDTALLKITQHNVPEALDALHKVLEVLEPKKSDKDEKDASAVIKNLGEILDKSSASHLERFKSKATDVLNTEIDLVLEKLKG